MIFSSPDLKILKFVQKFLHKNQVICAKYSKYREKVDQWNMGYTKCTFSNTKLSLPDDTIT